MLLLSDNGPLPLCLQNYILFPQVQVEPYVILQQGLPSIAATERAFNLLKNVYFLNTAVTPRTDQCVHLVTLHARQPHYHEVYEQEHIGK